MLYYDRIDVSEGIDVIKQMHQIWLLIHSKIQLFAYFDSIISLTSKFLYIFEIHMNLIQFVSFYSITLCSFKNFIFSNFIFSQ